MGRVGVAIMGHCSELCCDAVIEYLNCGGSDNIA